MSDTRLSGSQAVQAARDGALLIDVRSPAGRARNGEVQGAIIAAKDDVEDLLTRRTARAAPDQKVVLFCGSVAGTEAIVARLSESGQANVFDVDGGFAALTGPGGLPVIPRP